MPAYLQLNTFKSIESIVAAHSWDAIMKTKGTNWRHLFLSRGTYVALVRGLDQEQAQELRDHILAQFNACSVIFSDENTKCCVSKKPYLFFTNPSLH